MVPRAWVLGAPKVLPDPWPEDCIGAAGFWLVPACSLCAHSAWLSTGFGHVMHTALKGTLVCSEHLCAVPFYM